MPLLGNLRYFFSNPAVIITLVAFASSLINIFVLDGAPGFGLLLYMYGIVCFVIGFFVVSLCVPVRTIRVNESPAVVSQYILSIYWVLSFVSLVLSVYKITYVGYYGDLGGIFLNLRYDYIVDGGSNYGAQHLGLFALSLAYYYILKGNYKKAAVCSAIYLLAALAVAERTSIFFLFISIFYILYIRGNVGVRAAIFAFAALIGLFVYIAVDSGRLRGDGVFDFVYDYIGYGITNLSIYAEGRGYEGCGKLVFGTIYSIFQFDANECAKVEGLFTVQDRFNVYTYAIAPYLYGGWLGVSVVMLFVGAWYSLLWRMAINASNYFLCILAAYIYAVAMIFYAWQFNLTTYIYLAVILVPLFVRFKRVMAL